jgi:Leucine-rich repeat (LRR) protein
VKIPKKHEDVTKLVITGSRVEYLPRDLIAGFSELSEIELHNSVFVETLDGSFVSQRSRSIEYLHITGGKSTKSVRNNAFRQLPNLRKIALTDSGIEQLDETIFHNNTNLEFINFQFNNIQVLPKKIFLNLSKLQKINFAANQIEYLHRKLFKSNKALKEMNFMLNKITRIRPQLLRGLRNLRKIIFSSNQIEVISENTFQDNRKLRHILLEENRIGKINPDVFQNLQDLEEIILYKNPCYEKDLESREIITQDLLEKELSDCYDGWNDGKDAVDKSECFDDSLENPVIVYCHFSAGGL